VLVLSPQWFGALPILAACESGKAVYCAAGLDLDPETARTVKQRVEQAGTAFVAEFARRLAPATLRLKELIATRLGPPRLLFCHRRCGAVPPAARDAVPPAARDAVPPEDRLSGRSPQHAAVCELVELVDWCCYVVGREATWVSGLMHPDDSTPAEEDYQMMSLGFSDPAQPGMGPVAQISCGRYIPAGWQEAIGYRPSAELQVSCPGGVAFVDLPASLIWFDQAGRHQESLDSERPVGEQLLAQFHRVVTGGCHKSCDLEDAYRTLTIIQQARRSHGEGRRIVL